MSQILENIIKPTFKTYQNIFGGINVSQPPDQIADNQSPDMQNLIYINGALQVDTGYTQYGNRVVGEPLQPIQIEYNNGTLVNFLVTTVAFYTWDSAISDWNLSMTQYLSTSLVGTSQASSTVWDESFSAAFGPLVTVGPTITVANATGVSVGDIISIGTSGNFYYVSTVAAVNTSTGVVTGADPLLVGQYIPKFASVRFYHPFQAGEYPISWTFDPPSQTLIWTDGVDPVQAVPSGGVTANLGGLYSIANTARIVIRYYGYILAIGTTEGGTPYPYRVRRSTNVSINQWNPSTYPGAGFDDLADTSDAIITASVLGPYLILGREDTIMTGQYWGTVGQTFYWQYNFGGLGVLSGLSVAKMPSADVLVMPNGVFLYQGGYSVQGIGDAVFNYFLGPQGNMNPAAEGALFCIYISQLDEVWIFYPSGVNTYCDTLLRYSNKYGGWYPQEFGSTFSGACLAFNANALVWENDTLEWSQKTNAWNARAPLGNYPVILLASPSDRMVYRYDFLSQTRNGVSQSWYWTSKDYPVLEELLLFDGIVAYGLGNNIACDVSTDHGQTWESIGIFNFGTSFYTKQTLDLQIAADFFRFRLSGVGFGFFLSQFALRYLSESEF